MKQEQELDSLLSAAQSSRLDQILLQAGLLRRGPHVLLEGGVAERLGVDVNQRQEIDQLAKQWRDALDQRRDQAAMQWRDAPDQPAKCAKAANSGRARPIGKPASICGLSIRTRFWACSARNKKRVGRTWSGNRSTERP